jgi:hypothetical protein
MKLGFTPPMMAKVLTGQKTVTRRVVSVPLTKVELSWRSVVDSASVGRTVKFGQKYWTHCPYPANGSVDTAREQTELTRVRGGVRVRYSADGLVRDFPFADLAESHVRRLNVLPSGRMRLRYPRYMPAFLQRAYLQILDVRNEDLDRLTDQDAKAEGFDGAEHFIAYWDRLNAARGVPFSINPRVWVITFALVRVELKGSEHGTLPDS